MMLNKDPGGFFPNQPKLQNQMTQENGLFRTNWWNHGMDMEVQTNKHFVIIPFLQILPLHLCKMISEKWKCPEAVMVIKTSQIVIMQIVKIFIQLTTCPVLRIWNVESFQTQRGLRWDSYTDLSKLIFTQHQSGFVFENCFSNFAMEKFYNPSLFFDLFSNIFSLYNS